MLAILGCSAILFFVGIGFTSFVGWALREHVMAERFRMLEASQRNLPPAKPTEVVAPVVNAAPSWEVTFKLNGKRTSAVVTGQTEAHAIKSLIQAHGIGYGDIINSVPK